jgi:hypothetical protein
VPIKILATVTITSTRRAAPSSSPRAPTTSSSTGQWRRGSCAIQDQYGVILYHGLTTSQLLRIHAAFPLGIRVPAAPPERPIRRDHGAAATPAAGGGRSALRFLPGPPRVGPGDIPQPAQRPPGETSRGGVGGSTSGSDIGRLGDGFGARWTGSYSSILLDVNFWRGLPGEHILIFQTDSFLLGDGLDEWVDYDYVGAPWGGWWVDKHERMRGKLCHGSGWLGRH